MKILYVSSEVTPFIKTGGLADVAGALPQVLSKKGEDVCVVLPYYKTIPENYKKRMKFVKHFDVNISWRTQYCGVFELDRKGVKYYFIDNEFYFGRAGIYGYGDDVERFAFFSKAVLQMLKEIDYKPDIINVNDWQSSLVPTYLNLEYKHTDTNFYGNIKTMLTIHNIAYQGQFGRYVLQDTLGISDFFFENGYIEQDGDVNLLKAGIISADFITTVSKNYAEELKTDYYAHGLQHILRENSHKFQGVLNGIDTSLYNPIKSKHLFTNYDENCIEKKQENKKELLKLLSLEADDDTPVIAIISRFVSHKGLDLVESVMNDVLSHNIRLIVLGSGDLKYEKMFEVAKMSYPSKISVNITFSEDLANKIYAGADMLLMPSISEPCGLAQMISMRYGTIPVVRETGGLADSVQCYRGDLNVGNGFSFKNINAHDMLYVLREACGIYRNEPEIWKDIMLRAMKEDFSWDKSADEYIAIYKRVCNL